MAHACSQLLYTKAGKTISRCIFWLHTAQAYNSAWPELRLKIRVKIARRDLVFPQRSLRKQPVLTLKASAGRPGGAIAKIQMNSLSATRPFIRREPSEFYASEWRTWGGDVTRTPLWQGRTLPNNNKSRLHCRRRRADIFRRPPSALAIPKSTPPRCYYRREMKRLPDLLSVCAPHFCASHAGSITHPGIN